jgi:hypothetical protein
VDYAAPPLTGDHVLVDLLDASSGWTARALAVTTLDQAIEYYAYSWTKNNSYSTASVAFHASVIATLTPGQVFFQILPKPRLDQLGRRHRVHGRVRSESTRHLLTRPG